MSEYDHDGADDAVQPHERSSLIGGHYSGKSDLRIDPPRKRLWSSWCGAYALGAAAFCIIFGALAISTAVTEGAEESTSDSIEETYRPTFSPTNKPTWGPTHQMPSFVPSLQPSVPIVSPTFMPTRASTRIIIRNEYNDISKDKEKLAYPFITNETYLMEPLRSHEIDVTDAIDAQGRSLDLTCSVKYNFILNMTGKTETKDESEKIKGSDGLFSSKFNLTPGTTGFFLLEIQQACSNFSFVAPVYVKYVRRELSTLTETDREEFLDALYELWATNTVDGQKKYGEQYRSLYYFATIHNDGSDNGVCDEFKGGPGFLSNYVMLGAYLEQTMRLVNPRVSLHYMEYSKYFSSDDFTKGHLTNTMDGGKWNEFMTETWFGTSSANTGRLQNGRWASVSVPSLTGQFMEDHGIEKSSTFFPDIENEWLEFQTPHIYNPYGLLRARWNFSPQPFILRFNNVNRVKDISKLSDAATAAYRGVTCENYWEYLNSSVFGHSLKDVLSNMEEEVHRPIHTTYGGAGGEMASLADDTLRSVYAFSDEDLIFLTTQTSVFMKKNMRIVLQQEGKGEVGTEDETTYWECTEFPFQDGALTSTVGPGEEGGMVCGLKDLVYESNSSLNEFINTFMDEELNVSLVDDKLKALTFDDRKEAVKLIMSRVQYVGDIATSNGPIDPLFWVQHGALERLYQRIVLEKVMTDHVYDAEKTDCSGHSVDGNKVWLKGLVFEADKEGDPPWKLTNRQLSAYINPSTAEYRDNFNYIYDDGDFSWCKDTLFKPGSTY